MKMEQKVPDPGGTKARKPFAVGSNEGDPRWVLDTLDTVKATAAQTGGTFGVIESRERGGSGPPLHVHEREDEAYYVLEGEYMFFVGDETIPAPAGTFVVCPCGLPHTFRTESPEARLLGLIVPGGWESFFSEAFPRAAERRPPPPPDTPPDFDRISAAASRRGVTILGPGPGTGDA